MIAAPIVATALLVGATPAAADSRSEFTPFTSAVEGLEDDLNDTSAAAKRRTAAAEKIVSAEDDEGAYVSAKSASGVELHKHPSGVSTISAPRGEEAVQALASFESRGSSTEVTFTIEGTLSLLDDGLVQVVTGPGESYTIPEPWAKDARGTSVPTHFEIRAGNLVQIVEHKSGDYKYPVVADPWLGIKLFTKFKRDRYKGDYRYSGWVTPAGAAILGGGGGVGGHLAGRAVFNKNGWAEWKKKWPAITNKATLRHQYLCHTAVGLYGLTFTKDYNLERFRSNRPNWQKGVTKHKCNW